MLLPMSQNQTSNAWCVDLQVKLMAALDAAWALAEHSNDPAVIARARDKAKLCGQMASEARKVAALVPPVKGEKAGSPAAVVREVVLDALEPPEPSMRAPAAQAVAMQAALRKLKRR
jgi:hypothetical protein